MKTELKPGQSVECRVAFLQGGALLNGVTAIIHKYLKEGFYEVRGHDGKLYVAHEDDLNVVDPCQKCDHGVADIATRMELELSGALLLDEPLPWADMLKQVRDNSANLLLDKVRWNGKLVQTVVAADGGSNYSIYEYQDRYYCTCPDYLYRNIRAGNNQHACKHIVNMKCEMIQDKEPERDYGPERPAGLGSAQEFLRELVLYLRSDGPVLKTQEKLTAVCLIDAIKAQLKEKT